MPVFNTPYQRYSNQTFTGFCDVQAQGVTFEHCKVLGSNPDEELMSTGPQTKINDCDFIGHKDGQHRGIRVNSPGVVIQKSRVIEIKYDSDSQAIAGWSKTNNLLVEDCYLEASGENVLFGGADSEKVSWIPKNIHIRRCVLSKPLTWMNKPGITCKNLFELKNAINVTLENCVLENSFQGGQVGYAIVLTPRNQNGQEPWSVVQKVYIKNNLVRFIAGAVTLLGHDDENPSQQMNDVQIVSNSFRNIDEYYGMENGRQIQLTDTKGLQVINNDFHGDSINSIFDLYGKPNTGLVVNGNYFQEGYYGIHGQDTDLGTPSLDAYAPGYTWNNNIVVKWPNGRSIPYPPGTTVVFP